MAKINLLPKKPKNTNRKQTDKRKLRQKAYNSTQWRKLRLKYLMEHPMCEECDRKPAEDIHHIKSFIVKDEIDWDLLLNEKNLQALCKDCHGKHHAGKKIIKLEYMEENDNNRYIIEIL